MSCLSEPSSHNTATATFTKNHISDFKPGDDHVRDNCLLSTHLRQLQCTPMRGRRCCWTWGCVCCGDKTKGYVTICNLSNQRLNFEANDWLTCALRRRQPGRRNIEGGGGEEAPRSPEGNLTHIIGRKCRWRKMMKTTGKGGIDGLRGGGGWQHEKCRWES